MTRTLGRPREFDRESALKAAMLVFWRKGYLASSMNDLCDAMGIRSPSLYAAFGSKENLYQEAVRLYGTAVDAYIWGRVDEGLTVEDGMRKVLRSAASILLGPEGAPTGCLVTLAVGGECGDTIQEVAKAVRLENFSRLRQGLQRAARSGELARSTDIDALTRFYLGVVQGMAIQARDGAGQAELEAMAEVAMSAWPRLVIARTSPKSGAADTPAHAPLSAMRPPRGSSLV